MQLHEPLETTFERNKTRLMTYEEITHMARSARRMERGVAVMELLPAMEARIVDEAAVPARRTDPDSAPLLEMLLLVTMRQATLALAADDFRLQGSAAIEFQTAIWERMPKPEVVEQSLDALRDALLRELPKKEGRALDRFLRPVARFFIANAAVAYNAPVVIEEAADRLLQMHPQIEHQFADCRRFILKDFDRFLRHSSRGILADGNHYLISSLKSIHETMLQKPFGLRVMQDALDVLLLACERHLPVAQTLEFHEQLRRVIDFTVLSADMIENKDRIIEQATNRLYELHAPALEKIEKAREFTVKDFWRTLEAAAYGTHPAGQKELYDRMYEFDEVIQKGRFGGRLMSDAFQALLDAARASLCGQSLGRLDPVLHNVVRFIALSADVADHGEEIFEEGIRLLESAYPDQFQKFARQKPFMRWDQEQLLWAVRFSALPGWESHCAEMFDSFAHVLSRAAFFDKPDMMVASFDNLEKLCAARMTGQSMAFMMSRWRPYRAYLELMLGIAGRWQPVVKDAVEESMAKHAAAISRIQSGPAFGARDVSHALFTSAQTLIPGGGEWMVRGMEDLWDSLFDDDYYLAPLETALAGMMRGVSKSFPQQEKARLLPILDRVNAYVHAAGQLAACYDSVVNTVTDGVFAKHPDLRDTFSGAVRKTREDMGIMLHRALLATLPGGEDVLAVNLMRFADAVIGAPLPGSIMQALVTDLLKQVKRAADRPTYQTISPVLESLIQATECLLEISPIEDEIIRETIDTTYRKHAGSETRYRLSREKAMQDLRLLLRYATVLQVNGVEKLFQRDLRRFREVLSTARFDKEMMRECFTTFYELTEKKLSRSVRKVMMKNLEMIRDTVILLNDLACRESAIVDSAVDSFWKNAAEEMGDNPSARYHVAHDFRLALRMLSLAGTPGGAEATEEFVAAMKTVASMQRLPSGAAMKRSGGHLAQAVTQQLTAPRASAFADLIRKTFDRLA